MTEVRAVYTREQIWAVLRNYQGLAQGCPMPARGDRLSTSPPKREEAPWAPTSRLRADVELAMKRQPFDRMMLVFMAVSLRDWLDHKRSVSWREKVGDWWGISAGDVNKLVDETVDRICEDLNRTSLVSLDSCRT